MKRVALMSLCACALLALFTGGARAGDFDDVKITVEPVGGGVHALFGGGGNIGVSAGPDGILVADDPFARLDARIRAALATLGAAGPKR